MGLKAFVCNNEKQHNYLPVYMARNTTANIAHMFVIKRAVKPRGESTCTAA